MVSIIRVSRVGRVRVTLTVTVRVSRVSVMVSVRDLYTKNPYLDRLTGTTAIGRSSCGDI